MTEQGRIEELVVQELDEANKKYPLFHSPHEAYAVLAEEVDEMYQEAEWTRAYLGHMWECVKADDDIEYITNDIRRKAVCVAQESIQIIAMCDKIKQSELYEEKE